jgi:hypothetical protein
MRLFEYNWGGPGRDWYYFFISWEERPNETFYEPVTNCPIKRWRWDFSRYWYDGPHCQLNMWRIIIGWSTLHTIPPFEFCSAIEQYYWMKKPRWWRKLRDMEPYEESSTPSGSPSGCLND